MIQNKMFKNLWSLLFSLSLTFGTYYASETLIRFNNEQSFVGFSFILLAVFLLEIFVTWQYNSRLNSFKLDSNLVEYQIVHLLHKILLPIALYISIIAFAYYNLGNFSHTLVLVFSFFIYFALFYNIRAYFEHNNIIENQSHAVFDVIKFLIFFATTNFAFHNVYNHPQRDILFAAAVTVVSFIILSLLILRMTNTHSNSILIAFVTSLVMGVSFLLLAHYELYSVLHSTVVLLILFYLFTAYIHHLTEKTLSKYIVLEYVLVFIALAGVLYGVR